MNRSDIGHDTAHPDCPDAVIAWEQVALAESRHVFGVARMDGSAGLQPEISLGSLPWLSFR